jgi:hypothetical protein
MARWRVPAALTAVVLLAQLVHLDPLVDVVTWTAPGDVRVSYPLAHVLLAPLTLVADWLNGGSRGDLKGFAAWTVCGYLVWRLLRRAPTSARREAIHGGVFVLALGAFVVWGALAARPIPRLVAADSSLIIFDAHSHTSLSHDGRSGFGSHENAAWHRLAGFDAAFVTDHNAFGAAAAWRLDRAGRPPRLLDGEELSLSGLHVVALGVGARIANEPWNSSWDSTLAMLRHLSGVDTTDHELLTTDHPYFIASLPEYWRHHWGPDIGALAVSGIEGFEIWTTSPQAMDFPPAGRAAVIARGTLEHRALFGATDMHGLGYAATVWNVTRLPGWQGMDDAALARALIAKFRAEGSGANRVIALRRWQPATRLGAAVVIPVNAGLLLRSASRGHALALIGWCWLPLLLVRARRRGRSP